MPTYEYECKKCQKIFEYLQGFSEPPKKECECCGGELKKLLSGGAGIIFKGSGFYETDYKKSSVSTKATCEKTTEPSTKTEKDSKAPSATDSSSKESKDK